MEAINEQINIATQEKNITTTEVTEAATATEVTEGATPNIPDKPTEPTEDQVTPHQNNNLLYEQCLGFIPGSLRGKQDPRYVFAKFRKDYNDFDFTHKSIQQILEKANFKYLRLLQIL